VSAYEHSALASDRTMMLGLDGVEDGHARPMTAQLEDDEPHGHGPEEGLQGKGCGRLVA
jgi:hypothetical protein